MLLSTPTRESRGEEGRRWPVIVLWRRATTVIGLVRPPPAFVSSTCVPLWDHE